MEGFRLNLTRTLNSFHLSKNVTKILIIVQKSLECKRGNNQPLIDKRKEKDNEPDRNR